MILLHLLLLLLYLMVLHNCRVLLLLRALLHGHRLAHHLSVRRQYLHRHRVRRHHRGIGRHHRDTLKTNRTRLDLSLYHII